VWCEWLGLARSTDMARPLHRKCGCECVSGSGDSIDQLMALLHTRSVGVSVRVAAWRSTNYKALHRKCGCGRV
jgi:hypothetical protein